MARLTLSSYCVVFAVALFSERYAYAVSVALPAGKLDEGVAEPGFSQLLSGEARADDPVSALSSSRYPETENGLDKDAGRTKIFVITDVGLKGHSRGILTPPLLLRGSALLQLRDTDPAASERIQPEERRDTDEFIPGGRKDFDMLRCMLGRVYRPCWQL
ncbi:hypothetical protein MATL_G00249430 [Megalops atlanticus]|uniref:Melanin-concentrating hormone n=1 Tax=Megalops atlanticus TaxID=7932 RepID=A0A9D3SUN7_MEGAT|nr:hypothetical protein MATL_G00249430 [Megalops atlanticus]